MNPKDRVLKYSYSGGQWVAWFSFPAFNHYFSQVTVGYFKPDTSDLGPFTEILNKEKVTIKEKVVNKDGGQLMNSGCCKDKATEQ